MKLKVSKKEKRVPVQVRIEKRAYDAVQKRKGRMSWQKLLEELLEAVARGDIEITE